ncbi:MAG: RNase P modulator RnpM [Eubacterium sp.]|uniref:RNase P modulator RnpM n=1 Tax=Eubacterium sp. TaxID=142586 RepID=UPI003A147387
MKPKKEIRRMCVGCGEMFDKRELIRVVKSPEGEVSLDKTGKKNGRGAYVCNNVQCLKKARKRKSIERAFSMKIDDEVYDKMEEEIINAEK